MRLKGFPIEEATKQLRTIQQIPEESYQTYVEEARTQILSHHLQHNPFYKNHIGTTNTSHWEAIPILRKRDLQIPLQQRLSDGFTLKKVYKGKTSGSSGTPLHYAKDHFCHALTWAGIIDRFGWFGLDFNSSYQARF